MLHDWTGHCHPRDSRRVEDGKRQERRLAPGLIGTGLTPTAQDVEQVHRFIRGVLAVRFSDEGARIRIRYGGSVKPSNAAELMGVANVNGALVGGASLKAADFLAIAKGCP